MNSHPAEKGVASVWLQNLEGLQWLCRRACQQWNRHLDGWVSTPLLGALKQSWVVPCDKRELLHETYSGRTIIWSLYQKYKFRGLDFFFPKGLTKLLSQSTGAENLLHMEKTHLPDKTYSAVQTAVMSSEWYGKMPVTQTQHKRVCHLKWEAPCKLSLHLLQGLLLEFYLILLPVIIRIHCGVRPFCFCVLATHHPILKVLWEDMVRSKFNRTQDGREKKKKTCWLYFCLPNPVSLHWWQVLWCTLRSPPTFWT